MNAVRRSSAIAGVVLCTALAHAIELTDRARTAFDDYADRTIGAFTNAPLAFVEQHAATLRTGAVIGRPGSDSGIIEVTDGLIHHWRGAMFLRGGTLNRALRVSQSYAQYPNVYASIVSAQLIGQDGDTFHVRLRIKEQARMITSVLDITSSVTYVRLGRCSGYSISRATEIREIV